MLKMTKAATNVPTSLIFGMIVGIGYTQLFNFEHSKIRPPSWILTAILNFWPRSIMLSKPGCHLATFISRIPKLGETISNYL